MGPVVRTAGSNVRQERGPKLLAVQLRERAAERGGEAGGTAKPAGRGGEEVHSGTQRRDEAHPGG